MYPRLCINLAKITNNVKAVTALCKACGIDVVGVTKGVCASVQIAEVFAQNGVRALGDSRIQNLKKYAKLGIEKWLIRTPQISEVESVVRYANISINTEIDTLKALDAACANAQVARHGVILLQELGDLRDGIANEDELRQAAKVVCSLPHLYLAGIACNLTCLSFVRASEEKMNALIDTAQMLQDILDEQAVLGKQDALRKQAALSEQNALGKQAALGEQNALGKQAALVEQAASGEQDALDKQDALGKQNTLGKQQKNLIISGGNSATLHLVQKNKMPAGINNLRLGESLLIGKERDGYTYLPNTCKDAFILQAEIIELKEKPSSPFGEINADSFGNVASYKDRGMQHRAILAIGNQDCAPGVMEPLDKSVRLVGDSCDHLVCELDQPQKYKVGDIIEFCCGYHAILHAMTSEYVEKVYV